MNPVTASGRGQLKAMPLSKLRNYVQAYNIKVNRAVEKDDLVDGMMQARASLQSYCFLKN